jgi:hypothetical protein
MTIQTGAARMNEVIGVIDGLAFQTNILALNAAVEAARAGDQGRGFAVVASEVRALAQRCAASAREVRGLIETSSSQVDASVAQIRTAGEGMSRIVTGIQEVSNGISEISKASIDQSSGTSEVSSAVVELGALTQRNVELIERAVTQSNSLDKQASSLLDASLHFKLLQGVATEAVAMVERAMKFHAQASSPDDFLRGLTVKERELISHLAVIRPRWEPVFKTFLALTVKGLSNRLCLRHLMVQGGLSTTSQIQLVGKSRPKCLSYKKWMMFM